MKTRPRFLLPLFVIVTATAARSAIITSTFTGTTNQNYGTATNWSPTGVPANNATDQFEVVIPPSVAAPVEVNVSPNINSLGIGVGSTLSILNNIFVATAGDVANNGLILLNGSSSNTRFVVDDPVDQSITLGGSGILRLTHGNQYIGGAYGSSLINGASHTIEGTGRLGSTGRSFNLINQGTILANVPGEILRSLAETFQNGGLVRAENGGIFTVALGTVTQTPGGRFEVADGARFDFENTTLTGVSLTADDQNADLADNLYSLSGGGTRFKDVTLDATFSNNGIQLSLDGDFTNNGIFRAFGSTVSITAPDNVQVLLGGTGRMIMESSNQVISSVFGKFLTNGPSHTIEGIGRIAVHDFTNEGTVLANVPGEALQFQTTLRNAGLVRAENGAIVSITAGTGNHLPGGRFEVADGARFDFQNTTINGVFLTADDQNADLSDNLYSLTGNTTFKDVTLDATLATNLLKLALTGDLTNNGVILANGSLSSFIPTLSINDPDDGQVLLGGTGRMILGGPLVSIGGAYDNLLTNGPDHTIEGTAPIGGGNVRFINQGTVLARDTNSLTFRQRGIFQNPGTILIESGGAVIVEDRAISNAGLIDIQPGGTFGCGSLTQSAGELRVNGDFSSSGGIDVTGGIVTGASEISSGMNTGSNAIVRPGNPVGTLRLLGRTQIDGTVEIELQSDSVHDRVEFGHASGLVTLALKVVGPAGGFSGEPIFVLSGSRPLTAQTTFQLANVVSGGRLLTTDGRASFIVEGMPAPATATYSLSDPLFAPEFTAEPYAFSVDDGAPAGTVVGSVSAVDPEGSGVIYSIVGSTPFVIDATTGVITVNGTVDFGTLPVHIVQVGASDGDLTATTPVTISVNPLSGSNGAIVQNLLTGAGGPFPGQTDPAVVGFNADPDGDDISNVFELWLGTDPAVADGRADLVVFPLTVGPNDFAALDVSVVKAVDDVLVVNGQLSLELETFRNGTRSELSETTTTRRLRFLDSVAIPDSKALGRLAADPDAVK